MEVRGQLHTRPLYPQGNSSWYPVDRRLGGPQSRSGRGGEEKNSQSLPGFEPPFIQLAAQSYTTELSWLLFQNSILIISSATTSSFQILYRFFVYSTTLLSEISHEGVSKSFRAESITK
jgi:hypothetical protein